MMGIFECQNDILSVSDQSGTSARKFPSPNVYSISFIDMAASEHAVNAVFHWENVLARIDISLHKLNRFLIGCSRVPI